VKLFATFSQVTHRLSFSAIVAIRPFRKYYELVATHENSQATLVRSGVFKERRARGGPSWGVTRVNFPYFWWKTYYPFI